MKKRLLLITIIFSPIICQLSDAQKYNYIGEIKYHSEKITIAFGEGTDAGYNWNINVDEKFIIDATFVVKFTGSFVKLPSGMPVNPMFQLTSILSEDINIENSVSNEANEEKTSQTCRDGQTGDSYKVTPGDSRSYKKGQQWSLVDPGKKKIEGGFLMFRNNEYTISLMGKLKINIDVVESNEKKMVCSGEQSPPSSLSVNEVLEFPMAISGNGILENHDDISGYHTPVDIAKTDCKNCTAGLSSYVHGDLECAYIEKITMSWSLTKDCDVKGTVQDEINKNKDLKDFQKERINKVLEKLENPAIDARVFISATNIREVRDLDQADLVLSKDNGYLVDLRDLFNEYCEKYGNDKKHMTDLVIMTDKEIVRIINMFYEYYVRENMFADGQVKIKDWIADQQQNSNSIYSCYDGN